MNNDIEAGILSQLDDGSYIFQYNDAYFLDDTRSAVSLTLPKTQKEYTSKTLFPFFFSLLSEGSNRELQSKLLKIDEDDHFSLLLKIAAHETIGAIRVEEIR